MTVNLPPPSNSMEQESKSERYDDATSDETAPLTRNADYNEEDEEAERFSSSGCGCFQWRRWRRQRRQPGPTLHPPPQPPQKEAKRGCVIWLKEKAKKMKQLSEIVAGPRWKNFIRRNSNVGDNNKKKKTTPNFQYDPRSYALNFDEGMDKEDRGLYLNFSGRYVVAFKP